MAEIENTIKRLQHYADGNSTKALSPKVAKEAIQTIRELHSKSEEVCEWGRMGDGWYSEPTCDSDVGYICYPENMICEWKYCPYCGKKIKGVK